MAEYIEYHPLKFWLDPASIAEIVAHIQSYLVANPINSTTEIETIIHDYLIAHPEIIGGVRSINGETGEVVLTADNISGGENVTIKDVLDSLQDQIDDIVASIPSDYQQLINDVSDLKSALYKSEIIAPTLGAYWIYNNKFNAQNGYSGGFFPVKKGATYIVARSNSGTIAHGFNTVKYVSTELAVSDYTRTNNVTAVTYNATSDGYLYLYFGATTSDTITVTEYTPTEIRLNELADKFDYLESDNISIIAPTMGEYWIINDEFYPQTGYSGGFFPVKKGATYIVTRSNSGTIAHGFNTQKYEYGSANIHLSDYQHKNNVRQVIFRAPALGYAYLYFGATTSDTITVTEYCPSKAQLEVVKENIAVNSELISFEIGSLDRASWGSEIVSTTRARSGYIPCKIGDIVKSFGGITFLLFYFDANKSYIDYSYSEDSAFVSNKSVTHDGFVRIVAKKADNGSITNDDLVLLSESIVADRLLVPRIHDVNRSRSEDVDHIVSVRSLDGFANYAKEINDDAIGAITYTTIGKIVKSGIKIVDANGRDVVLTGIGTHSISEYHNLYTADVMRTLLYNGINCIRISVYLKDNQFEHSDGRTSLGWLNHSNDLKPIIDNLVDIATTCGLYVVLDWHSYHAKDGGDVTQYQTAQEGFFTYFSDKYKNYDNILYELHNEPYRNTALELLPSVQSCASIIRNNNADAILICGNGSDGATAMNTLFNIQNSLDIFISPHLYTGSQPIIDVTQYIDLGLPIFVSEWGNSSLSGTDTPNDERAVNFFNYLHQHGVSYCLWKMTPQNMDTSVLRYDNWMWAKGYPLGGWHLSDLSHNGVLYFNNTQEYRFNKHTH